MLCVGQFLEHGHQDGYMHRLRHITSLYLRKYTKKLGSFSWQTFGYLSVTQLILTILGIGSSVIWARYIPKETYGQYQIISSTVDIVAGFCLAGLGHSIILSSAKNLYGNFRSILGLKFIANILGMFALLATAHLAFSDQPQISHALVLAAFIFPIYELQKIWPPWLNGANRLRLLSNLKMFRRLLLVGIIGLLIFFEAFDLNVLVISFFGTTALFSLIVIISLYPKFHNTKKDSEIVKYGIHATAASLLGTLILSDKLIIHHHLSIEDVSIYTIALIFPSQIKSLNAIFKQMMVPHISAAASIEAGWAYLKPKFAILVGLFLCLGIVGFTILPTIIPLLFSEKYTVSAPYTRWLWLALSIPAPAVYLGNIIIAQQKKTFLYLNSTYYPVLLFSLYLLLIPKHGLWGAVGAQFIASLVLAIVYVVAFIWYLRKERNINPNGTP